jgi:zinc transporter ZupT
VSVETATAAKRAPGGRVPAVLGALAPLIALAVAVAALATFSESLFGLVGENPPPADEVDVRRVEFKAGTTPAIRLHVTNPQRDPLTVALVTVNDAVVGHKVEGPAEIGRLQTREIVIPYHWDDGDPYAIGVTTTSGVQTVHEVAAAVETTPVSVGKVLGFGAIGLLVGLLPVALGALWLPGLREAGAGLLTGFMALTGGLLAFLAVDALAEAWEVKSELPSALGGAGLVLLGVVFSFFTLEWLSTALKERANRRGAGAGAAGNGLVLATAIAVGIGLHNLGEGLAIGSSFVQGSLALGSLLIFGFMVHNITEGLGIVAPLAADDERPSWGRLAALIAIAGLPTVIGAWIGGLIASQTLAVFFFAAAAGAAAQVVYEVSQFVRQREPRGWRSTNVALGFVAGVSIMYLTGLLIG